MNGDCHFAIGRIAFDSLPAWERALIKPDISPKGLARRYIPPGLKTARDKTAFLCNVMDLVYYDEYRPYATLPDGRWIPHSLPDDRGYSSAGAGTKYSPLVSAEMIEFLLDRTTRSIQSGDWETAVHHAGALAHYLQEPFAPAHAIPNELLHELFPDPDPQRHLRLHSELDYVGLDFEPLPPRLMGTSIPEAAFRLQLELDRAIFLNKQRVGPIIHEIYQGKRGAQCASELIEQGRNAAFVTASAWHTAISIGNGRFDDDEVSALASLDLSRMIPFFIHLWEYVQLTAGALVKHKRKVPIHVWSSGPCGPAEEKVDRGFGMGGHMGIKFFINGDVYPRFSCRVGLPSRHTDGQGEHTSTTFFLETDTHLNRTYSEDIEYGGHRVFELELVPGAPVRQVDINVAGARTLIIGAKSQPYTDPATGRISFSIPHIAICEPELLKA